MCCKSFSSKHNLTILLILAVTFNSCSSKDSKTCVKDLNVVGGFIKAGITAENTSFVKKTNQFKHMHSFLITVLIQEK